MPLAAALRCAVLGSCIVVVAALSAACSPREEGSAELSRAAEREANGGGQPMASLGSTGAVSGIDGAVQLAALFRRCREAARPRLGIVTAFDDGLEPEHAVFFVIPSRPETPIIAMDRSVPYSALSVIGPVRGLVGFRGMVTHRPSRSIADSSNVYFCRVAVDDMSFDVKAVSIEIVR